MSKYKVGDKVKLKNYGESGAKLMNADGIMDGLVVTLASHDGIESGFFNCESLPWCITESMIKCLVGEDEPEYEIHHKLNDRFNNPEILYMSDVAVVYNVNDSVNNRLYEHYTSADDFWAVYKKVFKSTPATIEAMKKKAMFL